MPISSPRRSRGVATVSQASAPAHVTVLEAPWTLGLARAEGADEQPGAGLREPELVGVAGDQRRERPEEHRVDEDDGRDEDEEAAHGATLPA